MLADSSMQAPDVVDENGFTPLMAAIAANAGPEAVIPLARRSDLTVKSPDGQTALHLAVTFMSPTLEPCTPGAAAADAEALSGASHTGLWQSAGPGRVLALVSDNRVAWQRFVRPDWLDTWLSSQFVEIAFRHSAVVHAGVCFDDGFTGLAAGRCPVILVGCAQSSKLGSVARHLVAHFTPFVVVSRTAAVANESTEVASDRKLKPSAAQWYPALGNCDSAAVLDDVTAALGNYEGTVHAAPDCVTIVVSPNAIDNVCIQLLAQCSRFELQCMGLGPVRNQCGQDFLTDVSGVQVLSQGQVGFHAIHENGTHGFLTALHVVHPGWQRAPALPPGSPPSPFPACGGCAVCVGNEDALDICAVTADSVLLPDDTSVLPWADTQPTYAEGTALWGAAVVADSTVKWDGQPQVGVWLHAVQAEQQSALSDGYAPPVSTSLTGGPHTTERITFLSMRGRRTCAELVFADFGRSSQVGDGGAPWWLLLPGAIVVPLAVHHGVSSMKAPAATGAPDTRGLPLRCCATSVKHLPKWRVAKCDCYCRRVPHSDSFTVQWRPAGTGAGSGEWTVVFPPAGSTLLEVRYGDRRFQKALTDSDYSPVAYASLPEFIAALRRRLPFLSTTRFEIHGRQLTWSFSETIGIRLVPMSLTLVDASGGRGVCVML